MSIIEKAVEKLERTQRDDRNAEVPDERDARAPRHSFGAGPAAAEPAPGEGSIRSETTGRSVALDLDRLTEAGLVTPRTVGSFLAEQFRHIKRRILMRVDQGDRNANLIMVTSAFPGEGKTFTAINLAMSVAMERDRTVMLIDADVAKPDLCPVLGVEPGAGLMDLLTDASRTLPDVLIKTDVPKLTLMPAGHPTPHMSELLASDDMRRLAGELAQRCSDRIVIFDSMPLLAKSGASLLGDLVGQIVLVVEAVQTPRYAIEEALKLLDDSEKVGLILNKSRERPDLRYPYGYYHHG